MVNNGQGVVEGTMATVLRLGASSRAVALARPMLGYMASHGLLDNVVRVDSFGELATGDESHAGRAVFYVHGATEAQRAFERGDPNSVPRAESIIIDLDNADDVSYLMAELEELSLVYRARPVTLYPQSDSQRQYPTTSTAIALIDDAIRTLAAIA